MAMKRKPLAEATRDDLLAFARDVQNIEVRENASRTTIVQRLKDAGYAEDFIVVSDAGEAKAFSRSIDPDIAARKAELRGQRVRILIENSEGIDNSRHVPVGVNGYVINIERGVEVEIPLEHYNALMLANKQVPIVDRDLQIVGYRTVPMYPVRTLGPVPGAQAAA